MRDREQPVRCIPFPCVAGEGAGGAWGSLGTMADVLHDHANSQSTSPPPP